jgi:hypothetical protein
VFSIFPSRFLVAASNSGRSPSFGLLHSPRPHLLASYISQLQLSSDSVIDSSPSQSYVTTDGQSASLSWCQAHIWGLRSDFYYCQTVAGLLMWGALSDERTGLSVTIAAGPRQGSHSWVQVPRDS